MTKTLKNTSCCFAGWNQVTDPLCSSSLLSVPTYTSCITTTTTSTTSTTSSSSSFSSIDQTTIVNNTVTTSSLIKCAGNIEIKTKFFLIPLSTNSNDPMLGQINK